MEEKIDTRKREFSYKDFSIPMLVKAKKKQRAYISVVIPTLNEEKNVGKILDIVKKKLIEENQLVDEVLVIDSGSTDDTKSEVEKRGVNFFYSRDILPNLTQAKGKGDNLWKSLIVTKGNIIVWLDADAEDPDTAYVYGLLGPILLNKGIKFTKAFFTRFTRHSGKEPESPNGGRVTEILARPTLNLLFPELSHIYQPYNGNVACRKEVLEKLSFPTGYGADLTILIDIAMIFGTECIAQVFCKSFKQEGQDLRGLGEMAFQALRATLYKAQEYGRLNITRNLPIRLKQISVDKYGTFSWKKQELKEIARPPIYFFNKLKSRRKDSKFKLVHLQGGINSQLTSQL